MRPERRESVGEPGEHQETRQTGTYDTNRCTHSTCVRDLSIKADISNYKAQVFQKVF